MKVFESLNCSICKSPFAPIANQPKSPRHLEKEERKHKCLKADCFSNPNFSYHLIDILAEDCFFYDPGRSGYLLAKGFLLPECPACHEEFTINGQNQPYLLNCLHNLCKECFGKFRKANEGENKDKLPFSITCPKCQAPTLTDAGNYEDEHVLKSFQEVSEMNDHLRADTDFWATAVCDDCDLQVLFGDSYHCVKCDQKICHGCAEKNKVAKQKWRPYSSRITNSKCTNRLDKQLTLFLTELPEMTRQLEEMKNSKLRACGDCKCLDSIERMFNCGPCEKQICGLCAFEKHNFAEHQVVKLSVKEAVHRVSSIKEASMNEIRTYRGIFPDLHLKLDGYLKDLEEKFTSTEEMSMSKRALETLETSYNKCKRFKSDFESFSEEYLPNLRKYNTQLEGLLEKLEKDLN